jgi:hypothetical protein
MRFKGTAALFLLLLLLGGWVYFTDIRGRDAREEAEAAARRILPVSPEEIGEIRLIYPDLTLSAARSDSGWIWLSPEGLEADRSAWDQLASDIGRIEREAPVVAAGGDPALYGLDAPPVRIEVRMSDGASEEIRFGSPNPAGTSDYASLGSSPEVFLTASRWRTLFVRDADDLRDKTLVRFDPMRIERIELFPTGVELVLDAGTWFLEGPPRLRADEAEVASFLSALGTTRATGFAGPGEGPLDTSEARVVLYPAAPEAPHTLVFGPSVPDEGDAVYARDLSRSPVFTAPLRLRDQALRAAPEWRDKTIARFDPDAVVSIRIERPREGSAFGLERSGDVWTLADGRPVEEARVRDMLSAFDFQEASEVIDVPGPLPAYGLDPPELRVVLGGSESDLLAFVAGAAPADLASVYWKADGEAAVKVVPRSVVAPFEVAEGDLVGAGAAPGETP